MDFDPKRLPAASCERFSAWRSRLSPESATVIFADAYLANPPSMYGHTFIRLNRYAHRREERLLDYTINFSADTNTRNGIVFAIRGLMGGYPGRFSTTPYYIKVQEYTNLESRDLWEYHLSLTPQQLDRLVMHLWELGSTYFDYYFLTENCSYQLLPLIEIADPELDLSLSMRPWVIPIDTIRTLLEQPGLVTGVERRPSHMNKMLEERARLTADEIAVAESVSRRMDAQAQEDLERYPDLKQALILNAAYDYYRYREGFTYDQTSESKKLERRILLTRTRLGLQPSDHKEVVGTVPPHSGHKSGLTSLGFGATGDSTFEEISLRAALHDLIADQTGYLPDSQLEMFHLRVRYDNEDRVPFLRELALLKIFSLSPTDLWIRKPSWRVTFGMNAVDDLPFRYRSALGLDFGVGGATKSGWWRREAWYLLGEGAVQYAAVFNEWYRAGLGGTGGLLVDLSARSRAHVFATYRAFLLGDRSSDLVTTIEFRQSLSKDWDAQAHWRWRQDQRETFLGISAYF